MFRDAAIERTDLGGSVVAFPKPGSPAGPFWIHSSSGRPMRFVRRALVGALLMGAALCATPRG